MTTDETTVDMHVKGERAEASSPVQALSVCAVSHVIAMAGPLTCRLSEGGYRGYPSSLSSDLRLRGMLPGAPEDARRRSPIR
jgi:hypothetical protein